MLYESLFAIQTRSEFLRHRSYAAGFSAVLPRYQRRLNHNGRWQALSGESSYEPKILPSYLGDFLRRVCLQYAH
jgi:hypothetical protein